MEYSRLIFEAKADYNHNGTSAEVLNELWARILYEKLTKGVQIDLDLGWSKPLQLRRMRLSGREAYANLAGFSVTMFVESEICGTLEKHLEELVRQTAEDAGLPKKIWDLKLKPAKLKREKIEVDDPILEYFQQNHSA